MFRDSEKILAEVIALCREQWETIGRIVATETEPKFLPSSRSRLTVPLNREPNGVESPLASRARITKHFPTLPTNLRRDKIQELLSKEWLSKVKLVREVRKAFNLTNYPKYKDGGDVLTGLVYADFSLIEKSGALEKTTHLDGDTEYRFIPGSQVNWTKK